MALDGGSGEHRLIHDAEGGCGGSGDGELQEGSAGIVAKRLVRVHANLLNRNPTGVLAVGKHYSIETRVAGEVVAALAGFAKGTRRSWIGQHEFAGA